VTPARIADDVIVHEEEQEAFLLHVPSGRYFGLNPSGLVVWRALCSGDDPVAALQKRWPDVAVDLLRQDTERLLGALAEAGLVYDLRDCKPHDIDDRAPNGEASSDR
jgi:hypothetical protein